MTINCIIIEQIKKLGGTDLVFNGDVVTFKLKDQNWMFNKTGMDGLVNSGVDAVREHIQYKFKEMGVIGEQNG